ncbi:MAG: GNAT family N-acetyltransferase [Chloroflexi bacterium]|nr:GNAT family N-acetyltransferase [Chloroflexota bacterium]MDA1219302.1 GNAT family N-acetyltransferase [Chloroflexota bacterium]
MSELSVKSSFSQRIKAARRILAEEGFSNLCQAVVSNLAFHLSSKWHFVYFAFSLEEQTPCFNTKGPISVRIATSEDIARIESDIFPALEAEMQYEKRYFRLISEPKIKCFLAEQDGKLVHYSWVFLDASHSLLAEVPFNQKKLTSNDAFIGPVFTNQSARGLVYLHVLSAILDYLKNNAGASRAIVFFDGKNPAAASFYKRLGFKEITDAQPKNIFSFIWRGLSRATN